LESKLADFSGHLFLRSRGLESRNKMMGSDLRRRKNWIHAKGQRRKGSRELVRPSIGDLASRAA
jgi:hypothetical protein